MFQIVDHPTLPGVVAYPPRTDDNGLGFGQGSTAGVINIYGHRGFQRPQLPEIDTATRRRFNFRGYRGAMNNWPKNWPYACNYDPKPFYEEQEMKLIPKEIKEIKKKSYHILIFVIFVMIVLFYKFKN